jgi:hypothetical protein
MPPRCGVLPTGALPSCSTASPPLDLMASQVHARFTRLALITASITVALTGLAGCSSSDEPVGSGSLDDVPAFAASGDTLPLPRPTSEYAALVRSGGSAATLPDLESGPLPVAMSFDDIGVDLAPVVSVGVEANGDMEIPGANEVGWYRYGPTPGSSGSAVLAAHVSWNGRDGVFRRLSRAEPGQRFTIAYDDASIAEYELVAIRQYGKDELPPEIFATDGDPQVVLVTCGGSFNRALNSYDDNIVAYAVPI